MDVSEKENIKDFVMSKLIVIYRYSKKENLTYTDEEIKQFNYLLVEAKNRHTNEWYLLIENFETLEFVDCFNSIGFQYNYFVPVKIKTKPCIGILRRKSNVKYDNSKKIFKSLSKELPVEEIDEDQFIGNDDGVNDSVEELSEEEVIVESENDDYENDIEIENVNFGNNIEKSVKSENARLINTNSEKFETIIEDDEFGEDNDTLEEVHEVFERKEAYKTYKEDLYISNHDIKHQENDREITNILSNVPEESSEHEKEINFQELHNLALGKLSRNHEKSAKTKLRNLIEHHYRSKGSVIETQSGHEISSVKKKNVKISIKNIIKQEKIKEMVDQISRMDLTKICNLDNLTAKECLKYVIEQIDENDNKK